MADWSESWERLSPRLRRGITLGAGASVVGVLALLIATAPPEHQRRENQRQRLVSNLLTEVDPRDLGIDGLGRRLQSLERDVRNIAQNLERVSERMADGQGTRTQLLQTLRREREAELGAIRQQISALRAAIDARPEAPPTPVEAATPGESSAPIPTPPPLEQLFDSPPVRVHSTEPARSAAPALSIRRVADASASASATGAGAPAIPEVRIPAGSILQGVFLSGMDAPTGRTARQDPYPALLRLKDNAILPNRFRADIRECFLLVGGYGDLGSERVYLRAESINCVRRDGRTIEVAVDGYAVGEDGKLGVRGRLVNKQGQVIARAMQVSFLQGVSRLFGTVPVATVATGGSTLPYQQVFSPDALQGAAIAGTGKALDRLAEYYLDLAETIFPVLEVDAGRGVEVILNRGVGLKLQ